MKRAILAMFVLASMGRLASAQTSDAAFWTALSPSMAKVAKTMHSTIRRNLADAAELMPASDYSFKRGAEARTFAQLIGHVAAANFLLCSQAVGEKNPSPTFAERLTDKAREGAERLAQLLRSDLRSHDRRELQSGDNGGPARCDWTWTNGDHSRGRA